MHIFDVMLMTGVLLGGVFFFIGYASLALTLRLAIVIMKMRGQS